MMAKAQSENGPVQTSLGLILCIVCMFLAMSLFSYKWEDISLLKVPPNDPPSNVFGPVGAWVSFGFFMIFGVGAYLVPALCLGVGLMLVFLKGQRLWPKYLWLIALLFCIVSIVQLDAGSWKNACEALNIGPDAGGIFGRIFVSNMLVKWLSPTGASIVMWALTLFCIVMAVELNNIAHGYRDIHAWLRRVTEGLGATIASVGMRSTHDFEEEEEEVPPAPKRRKKPAPRRKDSPAAVPTPVQIEEEIDEPPSPAPTPIPERKPAPEPKTKRKPLLKRKVEPTEDELEELAPAGLAISTPRADGGQTPSYRLPTIDILDELVDVSKAESSVDAGATAQLLVDTLADFGIEGEITNYEVGPVVTSYELLPAAGIRVERIAGLANNLALSLKANSVRVQAPIPGKGVVGIEVPNDVSQLVQIRSLLEGKIWARSKANLPLVLGKDVSGNDLVVDLAAMPHLLIAGATGAGKTVCMNSVLAGLLMSRTPEQLRLLLVDPKIVEFSVYENLPHLVVPVITDPKKVALGLRWAINEMETRYKLFAKVGVRNIQTYNSREVVRQEDLFEGELAPPQKNEPPPTLPYIVIVIDELADLMLADQAGIENSIARLAQLSRAVGIHMIIATQRPSVNVITGTIKANFPGRIAFQVAQRVDSRTILDTVGADKLLGRGDMLYLSPGSSKLLRAQGAMTTDDEIRAVADYWRTQGEPAYEMAIKEKLDKSESASKLESDSGEDDDIINQAIEIIRETRRASTSSLQRRLRIGYTRAARVIDILEERGILGPPRGSEPREILIDLDAGVPGMEDDEEIEVAYEDDGLDAENDLDDEDTDEDDDNN